MSNFASEKWGFPISQDATGTFDEYLPVLVFADNFWIIAKSPDDVQHMVLAVCVLWVEHSTQKSARGQRHSQMRAAGGKWTLRDTPSKNAPKMTGARCSGVLWFARAIWTAKSMHAFRVLGAPSTRINALCVVPRCLSESASNYYRWLLNRRFSGAPARGKSRWSIRQP